MSDISFHGCVVPGLGLGRKIGFPTFNLDARPDLPFGVYAVNAVFNPESAVSHHALMHYGPKPTVGRSDIFCEIYFLKFPDGFDVREMTIHVLDKLRDVMKFDTLEALVVQMKHDEQEAKQKYFLSSNPL